MDTLTFRTRVQAALYRHELAGQISDGHWENLSAHWEHWVPWCRCEVTFGPNVGRNFFAHYDSYNFTSKDLLSVVSRRMILIARLAKNGWDDQAIELINHNCTNLEGEWTDIAGYTSDDACRTLDTYDLDKARADIADESYGEKELLSDLREMKKAKKITNYNCTRSGLYLIIN